MKFLKGLGAFTKKNQAAKGFQPKKTPQRLSQQTFILEPLITPSGLVDSIDHAPHPLAVDLHVPPMPEGHLPGLDSVDIPDPGHIDTHTSHPVSHPGDHHPAHGVHRAHTPSNTGEPHSGHPHTPVSVAGEPHMGHADIHATHVVETPVADHQLDPLPFIHTPSILESHAEISPELATTTAHLPPTFDSGVFTVGAKGEVSFNYLFDGGQYQGQVAMFNMEGMDKFVPGSPEFIHEAATRALSDSNLGHVVISDTTEAARFSGLLGEPQDWNTGEYQGVKTFSMDKGSTFGIMLVPNGTVQQVFDGNPEWDVRPLFSMTMANPNEAFHVGQIADVNGHGNTFVMEDLRMDGGSDHDYNDMIFQIQGATGKAVHMDQVVDPCHDWRQTELGGKLMEFIKPPENQPLIGVIDTGMAANNPDIDPFHVHFGAHSDYVAGDGNPLLQPNEGSEHGTHVTGIIAATHDNGIGIDGINDQAPIYEARAVGSGQWAQALTDFVDTAKESGQPHAIANLSLDLTQVNPDGSVTTRYEFTPVERAALEYARQNGVLIVAASGNDGGVMSALGQASQEFDNIITVGAAKQIVLPTPIDISDHHISLSDTPHINIPTDINITGADGLPIADHPDSSLTAAQAFDRADYSSYGKGLDIVANGGTIDNPVESTVGDGVGTMSGTSVATAQVTGAASQMWASNPDLSYHQVIEILKSTATDLKTPGWDMETGAGLLNITAAVGLAQATIPKAYDTPPIAIPNTWSGEARVIPMERAASDIAPNGKYYDWESYTIKSGDTLSAIALRTMGSATAPYYNFIAQKNGIADPDKIGADQQILIPKEVSAPPPPPTPTPTATPSIVEALRTAIIGQESGYNFKAVNPDSGALGFAQVMPANVKSWSREALGYEITPQQFLNSPDLQLKIIDYKLSQYWQSAIAASGGDMEIAVRRVAAAWYSGNPNLYTSTKPQYYNGRPYPSIADYTLSVLAKFRQAIAKGGTQPQQSPSSGGSPDFTGTVMYTGVNIRSGPGVNNAKTGYYNPGTPLIFDSWTKGTAHQDAMTGQMDDRWFHVKGTDNWVASAYINGNPNSNSRYVDPSNGSSNNGGGSTATGNGQRITDAVNKVNPDQGYYQPHDITGDGENETFCNWFAADVLQQLGIKLPPNGNQTMVKPHPIYGNQNHSKPIDANQLYTFFNNGGGVYQGQNYGKWQKVNAADAAAKANNGQAVVASGSGHIAMVIPGSSASDVRIAQAGATNGKNMSVTKGFGSRPYAYFVYVG